MAILESNTDLDVKGKVLATDVPNSTGSIVTWNTSTKVFGLRTNAQIIADLGLTSVVSNSHTHSNKTVLDGITSAKVSNWDSAYGWGNYALNSIVFNNSTNNPTNNYNNLDADLTLNSSRIFHSSSINAPNTVGFLDTTVYSNGAFQMSQGDGDNFYYRRRFGGTWRPWNQVASREWVSSQNFLTSSNLSGYVPYTGATQNLNLGTRTITTTGSLVNVSNSSRLAINVLSFYTASTSTGILSLKFPIRNASATMFDVLIRLYGYGGRYSAEYRITFYQQSSTAINATSGLTALISSSGNLPSEEINVGIEGSNICIDLGSATTSWGSHLSVSVDRLESKYTGWNQEYHEGWTYSFITDVSNYIVRRSITPEIVATKSWVTSQLPTNYITTNTNQTGLSGNKVTTGSYEFVTSGLTRPIRISNGAGVLEFGSGSSGGFMPSIRGNSTTQTAGLYLTGNGYDTYSQGAIVLSGRNALGTGGVVSGNLFNLLNFTNSVFSIDYTGKVFANTIRVSNLAGVSDTIVLSGAAGDVYNSTFKPSDFALAGSLGNYLRLDGTSSMTGTINSTNSNILAWNGDVRLHLNANNTLIGGSSNGLGGIYLRPQGTSSTSGQVVIQSNGQINTTNHGNSSEWDSKIGNRGTYNTADTANTANPNSVTEWTVNTGGFIGSYGTSLHLKGNNSWYSRLDIPTSGTKIELWQGINSTTMTNKGFIPIVPTANTNIDSGNISTYIPTVNNGQLTLSTGTGLSGSATFTANQSGSSTFSVGLSSSTLSDIAKGVTAHGWGDFRDYGLGLSIHPGYITNADTHNPTSFGVTSSSFVGSPFAGVYSSNQGYLNTLSWANSNLYKFQEHIPINTDIARRYRIKNNGVWGSWVTSIDTNNLDSQATSLGFIKSSSLSGYVQTSRTITAGNGLSGGGNLTANRTITLGTPSAITLSSTNSVTTSSHTHAFTPGGTTAQYIRGDGSLATMPTFNDAITSISRDGVNIPIVSQNVDIPIFSTSGAGLVPARVGSVATKYLREDGTWVTPTNTTYSAGTLALLQAGTNATNRVWSASILAQRFTEIEQQVAYYNDVDNINTRVDWGTNVLAGVRNQVQGARNIVQGQDINIFGSRNVSSGINNQINGFANVANGAFNTINGAYSSINGSQANTIGNYLFARDKQTVLGMYNKVYDVGEDEGLRVVFGTGMNDLDKFNAVEIYDDHRTEFHGKAAYDEETRNPEWFTEDYTHVDTYQMGYDHLPHSARASTPCEANILRLSVRYSSNSNPDDDRFTDISDLKHAFNVHGIVDGSIFDGTIDINRIHTKGTLEFSPATTTKLISDAKIDTNNLLIVRYNFTKGIVDIIGYTNAASLLSHKTDPNSVTVLLGSFILKQNDLGQSVAFFEFNQQII